MAAGHSFGLWANKGEKDKVVNELGVAFEKFPEYDDLVAPLDGSLRQDFRAAVLHGKNDTVTAGKVGLESGDRSEVINVNHVSPLVNNNQHLDDKEVTWHNPA